MLVVVVVVVVPVVVPVILDLLVTESALQLLSFRFDLS